MTRQTSLGARALVLGALFLLAAPLPAGGAQATGGDAPVAAALRDLVALRGATDCLVAPTDDVAQERSVRGRQSIEIKGRGRGGDAPGAMRDLAVYDLAAGRIVTYVCFANASTRQRGEAIVSLAEVSSRADKLVRALVPVPSLDLESIKRHRTDLAASIYYEARYAAAGGDFPFLEPPVRLLLNATTGSLFRADVDPDWLDPADVPRARISRKAAERIATVVLQGRDLAPALGPKAAFGAVAAAEMFTVHPNDWLGFVAESSEARARVAWVVPFRIQGGDGAAPHRIFIDAATGLVLGGLSGQTGGEPPP